MEGAQLAGAGEVTGDHVQHSWGQREPLAAYGHQVHSSVGMLGISSGNF